MYHPTAAASYKVVAFRCLVLTYWCSPSAAASDSKHQLLTRRSSSSRTTFRSPCIRHTTCIRPCIVRHTRSASVPRCLQIYPSANYTPFHSVAHLPISSLPQVGKCVCVCVRVCVHETEVCMQSMQSVGRSGCVGDDNVRLLHHPPFCQRGASDACCSSEGEESLTGGGDGVESQHHFACVWCVFVCVRTRRGDTPHSLPFRGTGRQVSDSRAALRAWVRRGCSQSRGQSVRTRRHCERCKGKTFDALCLVQLAHTPVPV